MTSPIDHEVHSDRIHKGWQQAQRAIEILASLSYREGNLSQYLRDIATGVGELLQLPGTVVTLRQQEPGVVMAHSGNELFDGNLVSLHGTLTETVTNTKQTLVVEDARLHPEYGTLPPGYIAYLGVPLKTVQGQVLGTICSFCENSRSFYPEDVRMVELFAERAATAIDNYYLYQQQRQFTERLEAEVARRTQELKAAQERLIHQERLAAIGEFASMIVHEIRNPVTTMTLGLQHFQKTSTAAADQDRAMLALEEAHRLQNLLHEILLFAKPQIPQLVPLDFTAFVCEEIPFLQMMPEASGRHIVWHGETTPTRVLGDRDKLKQVLINLVKNACEAIAPGESVRCSIAIEPAAPAAIAARHTPTAYVQLKVHNGGIPIPTELLPKLTQPFCSTKTGGTGLGLAIVKRIIDAHGGILHIHTDPAGTQVQVGLPQLIQDSTHS
ncbi:ATP-binding protein [Leptolyngbya sp. AN02str]|uniref:ATP-binding protein n=1 Tax=Leptolyngbya sp. AN02str TaxID=3423363 RepID=UPI003D3189AF